MAAFRNRQETPMPRLAIALFTALAVFAIVTAARAAAM